MQSTIVNLTVLWEMDLLASSPINGVIVQTIDLAGNTLLRLHPTPTDHCA